MSQICKICKPEEYKKQKPSEQSENEHSSHSESEHSSDAEHDSETKDHSVDKRDVNRHHHRHHHQKSRQSDTQSDDKHDADHFHTATDYDIPEYDEKRRVIMPTGKSFFIKNLVKPQWICGSKTKLVTLQPPRRMGRREFEIVSHEMGNTMVDMAHLRSGGGEYSGLYILRIQKVVQGCAWRRYLNRQRDISLEGSPVNEKMLFHGSPHVGAIIAGGFDERHSYAGGKLGAGIYFTPHSSVANQFVFGFFGGSGCPKHNDKSCYICSRHMLLCRVTLGTSQEFTSSSLGQMSHPAVGCHSAVGMPGEGSFDYPEYVIYRGEQAYPEYLITYRIVK